MYTSIDCVTHCILYCILLAVDQFHLFVISPAVCSYLFYLTFYISAL